MHPMNPIVSGLLNGLSIGNMLRRTAMEQQQLEDQKNREARANEIEDLKLADLMQERGIRPMGAEDIVNKMTGMVQGKKPGRKGGSTGNFTEQPNPEIPPADGAQGPNQAQVPYLQAEVDPGTLDKVVEVPDDNKYLKFRGQDLVVPGQRERIATAEATKRRELRIKADEAALERENYGQTIPTISKMLGLPAEYKFLPTESKAFAEAAGHIANIKSQIEDRATKQKAASDKQAEIGRHNLATEATAAERAKKAGTARQTESTNQARLQEIHQQNQAVDRIYSEVMFEAGQDRKKAKGLLGTMTRQKGGDYKKFNGLVLDRIEGRRQPLTEAEQINQLDAPESSSGAVSATAAEYLKKLNKGK